MRYFRAFRETINYSVSTYKCSANSQFFIIYSFSFIQQSAASSMSMANDAAAGAGSGAGSGAVSATSSPCKPGQLELERNLPGVMIAHESQVFKLLYQLADLGENK